MRSARDRPDEVANLPLLVGQGVPGHKRILGALRFAERCESAERAGAQSKGGFAHRPWCAAPQRLKFTELFRGEQGKGLRVSRYLDEREVRFSVWDETGEKMRAKAAVSLDADEAARLALFLAETEAPTEPLAI